MTIQQVKNMVAGYRTLLQFMHWRNLYQYAADGVGFEHITFDDTTPQQSVLVLAPHPDDEIFGCGGALAYHARHGDSVQVIYLTDGSRGTSNGSYDKSLITLREQEARAGLHIFGDIQAHFWKFPDSAFTVNKTTVGLLKGVLEKSRPTVVYLPWFGDDHPDHAVVVTLLVEALSLIKDVLKIEIRQYEVWATLVPNRILPIGDVVEDKLRAIEAHQSQLKSRAYRDGVLGLNAYRGSFAGLSEPAEAFFALPVERFLHFYHNFMKTKTEK